VGNPQKSPDCSGSWRSISQNGNICRCDVRVIIRSRKSFTVSVWHRIVFTHTWNRLRTESKSLSYAFSLLLIPPSIYTSNTHKLVPRPRKSLPSDRNFSYGSRVSCDIRYLSHSGFTRPVNYFESVMRYIGSNFDYFCAFLGHYSQLRSSGFYCLRPLEMSQVCLY
jgi:hypothetical protein